MQPNNAVTKRIVAEVIPYLPEKVKYAVLHLDKFIMQEIEEIRQIGRASCRERV